MKLAIFAVLMLVGLALAVPVAEPEQPKDLETEKDVEPKDLQQEAPADDLKADATYGWGYGGYYRPYYRSYYRPWGGYGGYYGGHRGWGGGWGGYGGWPSYYSGSYW